MLLAATMLAQHGIETPPQLLTAADAGSELREAWQQIPGQRSSLTGWRYLLLLAGKQEVKPDRMILRFVADAVGRDVREDEAAELVSAAAGLLEVQARELDYQIWQYQSGRTRPEETPKPPRGRRPSVRASPLHVPRDTGAHP